MNDSAPNTEPDIGSGDQLIRAPRNVSRRALLGGALGVAATLALIGCSAQQAAPNQKKTGFDAIVIGAGSAGVAAARHLMDAGKKVVVLEARDRTGGRLWTDRSIMTIPHERGASLVHGGPDTSTWPWAEQLKMPSRKFEHNFSRHSAQTAWVPWSSPDFYAFPEGTPKISLPLPEAQASETAQQYLERLGIGPSNYPLALLGIQVDTEQFDKLAGSKILDTLSECFSVAKTGLITPDSYAGDFKLLGPYDQIISAVSAGLDIRLNTVVDTVEYSGTGVTVQAGRDSYEATTCIVAVPIGVLQHDQIIFSPPLESDRLTAIDKIEQTVACKTILEFDHPVRPEGFDMMNSHDRGPSQFWDETSGLPGYSGQLIVTWDTGDRARDLLELPETERFSAALDGVRGIAGDQGLNFTNASNYDWRNDEFAFGAYATGERFPEIVYRPNGDTLFWAGAIKSTVATAHDSGVEAATAALAAMPA